MNLTGAIRGTRVGDRVEGPDWAADFGEELGGVDFRAQGAGIDEDDVAGNRFEGGTEMPSYGLASTCSNRMVRPCDYM
jgi:hypothetical protein